MPTNALRRKPPACRGVDLVATSRKAPRSLWIALSAVFVIAADQWSKYWAVDALSDRTIDVVWKLRFHLTGNTGFAFSTGQGLGPVLGVVALVVVVVLWRMRSRFSGAVSTLSLGLVLGGACGNLIDRALRTPGWGRGAVVDFIDLQFWPVFNVADMAIVFGVLLLSITMWVDQREAATNA
ncbi:MAG TPA: signal peptidase II [Acidimicrobiaceae bacterium]|nr:signal peptidase II [Acidimicrobiaceae bacterium]